MGGISDLIGSAFQSTGSGIGKVVGSITGATQASEGAEKASEAQQKQAQLAIDEQRRQFDAMIRLMAPYVQQGNVAVGGLAPYQKAGQEALNQQMALAGLSGPQAQGLMIGALSKSPELEAMIKSGENAMLQNAAATGGLRGGNLQGALAQFRPQMLSQLINERYGQLGGLSAQGLQTTQNLAQLGQASAAGQASSGLQSASNIGNLLGNIGAAQAGGIMGAAGRTQQAFGDIMGILSAGAGAAKSGAKAGLF